MRRCSGLRRGVIQRPQVALVENLEAGRRHADHGERLAVQRDGLADDRRVAAEARMPQALADHDDVGARARIVVAEGAADQQWNAQQGEELLRDGLARDAFRAVGGL